MLKRPRLFTVANAHVLMVSFLLGSLGALLLGIQQTLKSAEDSIRPSLKVLVLFQPSFAEDIARQWVTALSGQDAMIDSATYISRQEALEKAQGNPALAKSLILLKDNPLPASVMIFYKDEAWLMRQEPALALNEQTGVQRIIWNPEARSIFRSVRQWRVWIMRFSIFSAILLSVWCFFGVYRFLAMKSRLGELMIQLGVGLIGGGLAAVTYGIALSDLGGDAALFRPHTISFWPIAIAIMVSLATFGWKVQDDV